MVIGISMGDRSGRLDKDEDAGLVTYNELFHPILDPQTQARRLLLQYLLDDMRLFPKLMELSRKYRQVRREEVPPITIDEATEELSYTSMGDEKFRCIKEKATKKVKCIINPACENGYEDISFIPQDKKAELREELERLVKPVLRQAWLLLMLEEQVTEGRRIDVIVRDGQLQTRPLARLKLDLPIYHYTTWGDVIAKVKQRWEELELNTKGKRARQPENLELHVKWLCRHILLGHTSDKIETLYPDSKHYEAESIDLSIRKTAKIVGLKLPRGRPAKSKKR